MWINPPSVYEVAMPRIQKTIETVKVEQSTVTSHCLFVGAVRSRDDGDESGGLICEAVLLLTHAIAMVDELGGSVCSVVHTSGVSWLVQSGVV